MSFRDVAGQVHAIEFFRRAIGTGRLAHAYILVGPEGVGKHRLALALAQYFFCKERNDDACGNCRACRLIEADRFGDCHWYRRPEGKRDLPVETIEQFQRDISLKPLEADRKVFILEDADRLNPSSANRLLKILEEPPENSLLLLLALDVRDFLPTILSRCHVVRLRPMPVKELAGRLERERGCSPQQAAYLAHFTMGSPGLAETLSAGDFLGVRDRLITLAAALRDGGQFSTAEEIFKLAGDAAEGAQERRETLLRFLDVFALFYRDVLALAVGGVGRPLINADHVREVEALAGRFSPERVRRILDAIEHAREAVLLNANQKLLLENLAFEVAQLQSL